MVSKIIKNVSKITRLIESGATEPLEGIIDDNIVIIKTFNNRWGNKVLINEFICLEIAKLLNLPIPNGGICKISEKTDITSLQYEEILLEDIEGIGFYSEKLIKVVELTEPNSLMIARLHNKQDILRVILFDHLIYNTDRHDGNMLIDISPKNGKLSFYIIDHSHVFNKETQWNLKAFEQLIQDEDYKDSIIMTKNKDVYDLFYKDISVTLSELKNQGKIFKEKLNKNELENIINKVPDEWFNNIEDKKGILDYLLYRLENINYMCELIIRQINGSGGEQNENTLFDT